MHRLLESLQQHRTCRIVTIFICLQILDLISTLVGLRSGASEANLFVAQLLRMGSVAGLVVAKLLACLLAAYALRLGRERLLRIANFWFVGIVTWNLVVIHAITAG